MEKIQLRLVGRVKNNFRESPPQRKSWQDVISKIMIESKFAECLEGIEDYSHIVVIYWMHKIDKEKMLTGAFANRSPFRPNPIGLTIVELIRREGNALIVKGLDAFDGSPVLDIKPYTGHPKDLILDFRSPDKF